MIKSKLIEQIASKMPEANIKDVTQGVNELVQLLADSLINKQRIEIRGFGSFDLHLRAPRNAHNPKTGEKVVTESKYSVHFKPGKELRERVNESRRHFVLQE